MLSLCQTNRPEKRGCCSSNAVVSPPTMNTGDGEGKRHMVRLCFGLCAVLGSFVSLRNDAQVSTPIKAQNHTFQMHTLSTLEKQKESMFKMISNLHNKRVKKNYISDQKATQGLPSKGLLSGVKSSRSKASRALKSQSNRGNESASSRRENKSAQVESTPNQLGPPSIQDNLPRQNNAGTMRFNLDSSENRGDLRVINQSFNQESINVNLIGSKEASKRGDLSQLDEQ